MSDRFAGGWRIDPDKLKVVGIPADCESYKVRIRVDEAVTIRLRFRDRVEYRYMSIVDPSDPNTLCPKDGYRAWDKIVTPKPSLDSIVPVATACAASISVRRRSLLRLCTLGLIK